MFTGNPSTQAAPPSAELLQSLKTIKSFLELFPAAELENDIWQFAFNLVNSKEEHEWDHINRTNIFFIYNQLLLLSRAIVTIDKELGKNIQ